MDERLFRKTMGKFATGVTVITTKIDGEVYGMTANAFMSVSLDPKLVVISIDEKAKMLDRIKQSQKFAVNILSENQKELSMIFAGQRKEQSEIKFAELSGLPVLEDAVAQVACDVVNSHVEGDHTLFIGKVNDIQITDEEPLVFFNGQYHSLASKEAVYN